MRLFVGSDHAGYLLKEEIKKHFSKDLEITDVGTNSEESCDYPDFAEKLSRQVLTHPGSLGLLICGTGVGMSITANKVRGIRAACVSEPKSAALAREHNDAQVLCLGARIIDAAQAIRCLEAFLQAQFDSSHERHQRRIEKIGQLEDFELRVSHQKL